MVSQKEPSVVMDEEVSMYLWKSISFSPRIIDSVYCIILHSFQIILVLWSHIDNSSSYNHPLFKRNLKFPILLKHVLWNITFSEQILYALFSCICTKDLIIGINSFLQNTKQSSSDNRHHVPKVLGSCERASLSVG